MGKKRGRNQRSDNRNPNSKRRPRVEHVQPEDMDDEVDAFHKQRDIIPLDVNGGVGDSTDDDDDDELPVFDYKDINGVDNEDSEEEEDSDNEEDEDEDSGLARKIARQQKYLQQKFGGVEDELPEEEEDDQQNFNLWSKSKYGGDNARFEEKDSDDESPMREEQEVIAMQKQKAKSLSMEDFGLEDVEDDSDRELTLEEVAVKGKSIKKDPLGKEVTQSTDATLQQVKQDLSSLLSEKQMDIVNSSAPELVGLLSELNDALEQLETRINPLLTKVKQDGVMLKGPLRFLEVKQVLLLVYCQAITFYLLLKSEGQPVLDHPVIARLVEIKGLLDKMKQFDGDLPSEVEEIMRDDHGDEKVQNPFAVNAAPGSVSNSVRKDHDSALISIDGPEPKESLDINDLDKVDALNNHESKEKKHQRKNDEVSEKSKEMLKVREALEEKLKKKGVFSSLTPKPDKTQKHLKPLNGQLETYNDFDDDTMGAEWGSNGLSKGHKLVTPKPNKLKVISGDDDLPKRDDIGERRRKHELRVLAGAGVKTNDDARDDDTEDANRDSDMEADDGDNDMEDSGNAGDSADEFYKEVKQKRDARLAAKAQRYTRTSAVPSLPETVDGKRQIGYMIEKNRGLTRPRNKLTKNPRKKYKLKHKKLEKRRKGQVRSIKTPGGSYGGETSGINKGVSRSVRFS